MIHFPRPFSKEDLFPVFSTAVSMSILASSFGALIAASYSTFCKCRTGFRIVVTFPATDGRRPVYLYTSLAFVIGSAGVATAQNIPSLLFWRFFQCMGGSLGPAIGAAVIGDIFKLEERGGAMGICFAVSKLLFVDFGCLDMISID